MTTPRVATPFPQVRNLGNTRSFFAAQQESPTSNPLISRQVDPTAPQVKGLVRVSDPVQPSHNAQVYVSNFDPALYDLRDTSHIMRFIRALTGASGVGGAQKQRLVARLTNMLGDGAFFDLDRFYGSIFGLQRHPAETMPTNIDGTVVNPYTDLANSDLWDDVRSRDARYRSRLFQLARAVNMGPTFIGLKSAAEAVLSCEVDMVESWVKTDFLANNTGLQPDAALTYFAIENQYVTYGELAHTSYGTLQGSQFGDGVLPAGNRGELIFTPRRQITLDERYRLQAVLNTLKPSSTQVTIATQVVETSSPVTARGYSADSENWQIQARITPAIGLVNPGTPVYNNAGPYSMARPVFSEYTGEQWTYNPTVVRAVSYQIEGTAQSNVSDNQGVTYTDKTSHVYAAGDGVRDARQAISHRLSGEGATTYMPYGADRTQSTG